jgi:NADH:ubiquinone oxidoreductase subunit 6 (subunit J)
MNNDPCKSGAIARPRPWRHVTFVGLAIVVLALFGLFHLLGWRDDTAIISGTSISPDRNAAALRGVLYALTYFLAVIVSPILLLAAMISAILRRWVIKV